MAIPLAPTKVIPTLPQSTPTITPTSTSTKRPFITPHDTSRKRPKSRLSTPNPEFKIPLLPRSARALTPSTSTVAASSSPNRSLNLSSSPTKPLEEMEEVVLTPGQSLIFGRHRHAPTGTASTSTTVSLRSNIPTHLHHLVSDLERSTRIVYLARTASHASRTHALVEYIQEEEVIKVLVIGQNGMKINGKRVLAGQRVEVDKKVESGKGRTRSVLDFYGTKVAVKFPDLDHAAQAEMREEERSEDREEVGDEVGRELRVDLSQLFTPDMSSPVLSPALSLPPSSPPLAPLTPSEDADMDDEDENGEEVKELPSSQRASSPVFSTRGSSPLSAAESEDGDAEETKDLAVPVQTQVQVSTAQSDAREKSVKQEMVEQHVAGPSMIVSIEHDPIPSEIDLPALLASTVVFSGSSKLSLPDLVKHMLDSQSSLKDLGSEARWEKWANEVLEHNPMFGKVLRHGKDSSGHPLLPHYFYNPANDLDTARAQELGGLVRPLRTVQRAGGKAIDWRPVGSGRRRY